MSFTRSQEWLNWLRNSSTQKLEKLCSVNVTKNRDAYFEQRRIARYLAIVFEQDNDRALVNHSKAFKYRQQSVGKSIPLESSLGAPQSVYSASSWYNFGRLLFLRVGMITEYFGASILPPSYGIAGFLYVGDALYDIGDVAATTLKPPVTEREKKIPRTKLMKERFKKAFDEEGRAEHFENAIVWGPLNVITNFITGIPGFILTCCGYVHDLIVEVFKGSKEYLMDDELLQEKKTALTQVKPSEAKTELETIQETNSQRDVKRLETWVEALSSDENTVKLKRGWSISTTGMTLTGCAFLSGFMLGLLPPPLNLIGIGLILFGIIANVAEKGWETYKFFQAPKPCTDPNYTFDEDDIENDEDLKELVMYEHLTSSYSNRLSPSQHITTSYTTDLSPLLKGELAIDLAVENLQPKPSSRETSIHSANVNPPDITSASDWDLTGSNAKELINLSNFARPSPEVRNTDKEEVEVDYQPIRQAQVS